MPWEDNHNTQEKRHRTRIVQCIPRYIRNLMCLRCRVMPEDAAAGLGWGYLLHHLGRASFKAWPMCSTHEPHNQQLCFSFLKHKIVRALNLLGFYSRSYFVNDPFQLHLAILPYWSTSNNWLKLQLNEEIVSTDNTIRGQPGWSKVGRITSLDWALDSGSVN